MEYEITKQGVGGYGASLTVTKGKFKGINIRSFNNREFHKNKKEVVEVYETLQSKPSEG